MFTIELHKILLTKEISFLYLYVWFANRVFETMEITVNIYYIYFKNKIEAT